MKMEITTEVKAKVFAQYLGNQVQVRKKNDSDKGYLVGRIYEITHKSNHGDWIMVWFENVCTATNQIWNESTSNAHTFFFGEDETRLILKPISEITKSQFYKLFSIAIKSVYSFVPETREKFFGVNDSKTVIGLNVIDISDKKEDVIGFSFDGSSFELTVNAITLSINQVHLFYEVKQMGVDLPIVNGKTLKEAGLAIYENEQQS